MYTDDMMNSRIRVGEPDGCDCGCGHTHEEAEAYTCGYGHTWGLDGYPVGMVFAPLQRFDHIYDLETAMKRGTIFEELDLPFGCGNDTKGGCCHG